MSSYIECESYAHRFAKETLAAWFREKWKINRDHGESPSYYLFNWNPDSNDGQHGIYLEYPLLSRKLADESVEILGAKPAWKKYPKLPPDSDKLSIEAVLDVAVCSNGKLLYGFEIVHKHPCTPGKLIFLKELRKKYGIKVYEVSARWILDQVKRPVNLKLTPVN